jgi:hypothetical protein
MHSIYPLVRPSIEKGALHVNDLIRGHPLVVCHSRTGGLQLLLPRLHALLDESVQQDDRITHRVRIDVLKGAVDIASMSDFHDRDQQRIILNLVKDAVYALTDAITFLA